MLRRLLPFLDWLPELRRPAVLRADVVAGATVAAIVIPQSMAYASLAGLPAVYGLYAAFLPPMVASLWGSSRQLVTGPMATASLISAATIHSLGPVSPEAFVGYSLLLALMVGLIRLALGVLRLGLLVNLLSGPVTIGFINAGAVIIATSQLQQVLGIEVRQGAYHYQTVLAILGAASSLHWPTVGLAAVTGGIMVALRYRTGKILLAVAAATLLSWGLGYSGRVVGAIHGGLPGFQLPPLDPAVIPRLFAGALTLTFVGLTETMSIAKTVATRTKQHIDVNRELVGQGMANIVGGLFQSFAVSGSFARTAVNFQAGAVTGFAAVVASAVVGVVLLFLTPLLRHLPQAALAAVIILAVLSLFRVDPVRQAWRVSRVDAAIAVVTFAVTLVAAPRLHLGIAVGVALSLAQYLRRTMRPHVAYLARSPRGPLVDADANGLQLDQRIAIIRFDGRLYFGASAYFQDKVLEAVSRLPELRYLVLDAGGINQLDSTGEQTVRQVVEDLRDAGLDVYFTRVKPQFRAALERTGTIDFVGRDHFFEWNQHALEHLWSLMEPAYRARCPLNVPTPQTQAGAYTI
ncbi:MAG: SulP family inorganic anion transporter [Gemmatimonadota bacterium]